MPPPTTLPSNLLTQESQKGLKRPLSINTSSSTNETDLLGIEQIKEGQIGMSETDYDETCSITSQEEGWKPQKASKQVKKKKKINPDPKNEDQIWEKIEKELEKSNEQLNFPLNLTQFRSLLDNSKSNKNITELIKDYTDKIEDLINMCQKLHNKMNLSLKNRCTRLIKKLKTLLESQDGN